jgi:hypothetical protein
MKLCGLSSFDEFDVPLSIQWFYRHKDELDLPLACWCPMPIRQYLNGTAGNTERVALL